MPMHVLGLAGSPRKRSNTRLLLDRVLEGAQSRGAQVETIDLCRTKINPCIACDGCFANDRCVVDDEFQQAFDKLIDADRIVMATPVYFMGVSAQAKSFIDRCQCLWARKYVQKLPLPAPRSRGRRRGYLICTAGSRLPDLFSCAQRTFSYFLDALDAEAGPALLHNNTDELGSLENHPTALDEALSLGEMIASISDLSHSR